MAPSTTISGPIEEAFNAGDFTKVVSLINMLPEPIDEHWRIYRLYCLVELARFDEAAALFAATAAPGMVERCLGAWAFYKTGKVDQAKQEIADVMISYPNHARPHWTAANIARGDKYDYMLTKEQKASIRDQLKNAMSAADCWRDIYREYASLLDYDSPERESVHQQAHERWPEDEMLHVEYGEAVFARDPEAGSAILGAILAQEPGKHGEAHSVARATLIDHFVRHGRYADAWTHLRAVVPAVAHVDRIYVAQLALLAGDAATAKAHLATTAEPRFESDKIRLYYTQAAILADIGSIEEAMAACRQAHALIDQHEPLDLSDGPVHMSTDTTTRYLDPLNGDIVHRLYDNLLAHNQEVDNDVFGYLECQLCALSPQEKQVDWALKADARLPIEHVKRTLWYACLRQKKFEDAFDYALDAFLIAQDKQKSLDEVDLDFEFIDTVSTSDFKPEHFVRLLKRIPALIGKKQKEPVRALFRRYLSDWLIEAGANREVVELFRLLNGTRVRDTAASDVFTLALALHRLDDLDQAEKNYRLLLSKKHPIAAACYNLSLILEKRGEIDAAVTALAHAQPFQSDSYRERYEALCRLRDRRDELLRFSIVYNENRKPAPVDPYVLSLHDAVYLLAVVYALQQPNGDDLVPEVNAKSRISPQQDFTNDLLDHLLNRGLLYIDPSTPRDSYSIQGKTLSYDRSRVKWRLNVYDGNCSVRQVLPYIEKRCRDMAKEHPDELDLIAQTVALWEVLGYLKLRMDAYGYPYEITDKTIATFREITATFGVARGWNIVYQALESAAAKQVEERLTRRHAANLAVSYCRSRANKAWNEGWQLKPYDRPKEFPESAMTHAWCYIANVNGIDFLNSRSRASKTPLLVDRRLVTTR